MHLRSALYRSGSALLLLTAAPQGRVVAQEPPPLKAGDRIEVRIVAPASAITDVACSALVADLPQRDTLRLDRSRNCPRGAFLADLRVARGGGGSRLTHAVIGTLVGAVAGAVIAGTEAGDGCRTDVCNPADGGYAAAARTTAGVVTGAVVGAVLGFALPAGPRWADAGTARPIVVGTLVLQPSLEVSAGMHGRARGLALGARH